MSVSDTNKMPELRRSEVRSLLLVLLFVCTYPAVSQTKWFKYEGNPVLDVGPPGSWEEKIVVPGRVIVRDNIYQMWYSGSSRSASVGYAFSRDGIHWMKEKKNPILIASRRSWDIDDAYLPYVVSTGSQYRMWYSGGRLSSMRLGCAISADGKVWRKEAHPVLRNGFSSWDSSGVSEASVLGPDDHGQFKMWFMGYDAKWRTHIGYATGINALSWEKNAHPVLAPGKPGSWDDQRVQNPRVLFNGQRYEMWFIGNRNDYFASQIGYATSSDGIEWTKFPGNPVVSPGPNGSWDDESVHGNDIFFDGQMYYMWYGGYDGSVARVGLAVSPKDLSVAILPSNGYVPAAKGEVKLSVKANDPGGFSLSARIMTPGGPWKGPDETRLGLGRFRQVDLLELFDDGTHGDSLAHDGIFANSWVPQEEDLYFVDLKLTLRQKNSLNFEMSRAGTFTSIGPIQFDNLKIMGSSNPNPGDTVLAKLTLRNTGLSATAYLVSALLSSPDARVADVSSSSLIFGNIAPSQTATTDGYYRVLIDPECPPGSEVRLKVSVSSYGIPLWTDTFELRVGTPWWRTEWAYGFYAILFVGVLLTMRRLEKRRSRLKQEREMEHFQAEKLKELDQLKSRFFANISHEFRTPLTLIEGPLKQLKSGHYAGNADEQYDMMLRNTQRLERLVNQLLDLSRIESGQMKLHMKHLDIVEVVRGIVAAFESLAKQKGVNYKVTVPKEEIVGWFDRDAVEKILTNLLSNAFKFTPEGGDVHITMRLSPIPTSAHVSISVTDTGAGMGSLELDRIFDRFYQVDASQTREQEGSGIGLALTKELVELYHGHISVQSELGHGSTFTVHLPLEREHLKPDEMVDTGESEKPTIDVQVPMQALQPTSEQADESLPLLLVVEDNADMRRYMRNHLEADYRIIEANNGAEGVDKATEEIPDVVISDVMMPKMDGFELCRRLKTDEKTSHIPIILLTAKAASESKLEGLKTGADDYLVKPFDAMELIIRIKNLIEQRRKLRERFQREVTLQPHDIPITPAAEQFLNKAKETVENHLSDGNFGLDVFAEEMALSRSQLHRKLYALTGVSPGDFIRSMRLQRAALLLQKHFGPVTQVAYEVGFNNPSHFSESFRRQFGVTPSKYSLRNS